jgi:phosphoenolpyruvate carboxykinase (ATP)
LNEIGPSGILWGMPARREERPPRDHRARRAADDAMADEPGPILGPIEGATTGPPRPPEADRSRGSRRLGSIPPRIDDHGPSPPGRHGITVEDVRRNLPPSRLYEEAIRHDPATRIADSGALVAYSGAKTGRSPKDKRVVRHPKTEGDVWWGPVNVALDPHSFEINRERAKDYLNTRDRLYCIDGFAGWDPAHRVKVRVICSRPYHALFMHIMMIRPDPDELASFGEPDYVIYNAGRFPANRLTAGMTSTTSVDLSIEDGEVVILGPSTPAR